MIKAIMYDLDGVLVDACEWHYIALNKALKKISNDVISRVEHETVFNGLPTKTKLDILIKQGRVRKEDLQAIWDMKQNLTKETIEENAKIDEKKITLHVHSWKLGIKMVCVTNSITETASLMLEKTGQLSYMDFIVSNEMVRNPKPHGEGYIRAMVKLGTMPDECLIVEDSEKGLKAAASTGAFVLHVKGPDEVPVKVVEFLGDSNGSI